MNWLSAGRPLARWSVLVLLCLGGLVRDAAADITIQMNSPSAGHLGGEDMLVRALIASTRPLASVTAGAAGRTAPMVFAPVGPFDYWAGTVDLHGVPRGSITVSVTVQDIDGLVRVAEVTAILDRLPVLTVTAPQPGALARPDVRIIASCTDDGPSCRIAVASTSSGEELASADGTMDTIVSLRAGERAVHVQASDSAGQAVGGSIPIVVDISPYLSLVASFPGRIIDIDPLRALVLDDVSTPARLLIVDRATMASQVIFPGETGVFQKGFLSPRGAICAWGNEFIGTLREWRDGASIEHGQIDPRWLRVAGDWAAWSQFYGPPGAGAGLWLRNLADGVTTVVDATSSPFFFYAQFGLNATGDLAYRPQNGVDLRRYRPTDQTDVLALSGPIGGFPLIEGEQVVAVKTATSLVVGTSGTETVVPALTQRYSLVNGRLAFLRDAGGGVTPAFVRAADGTEQEVLRLGPGGPVTLEALGPNRDVIVEHPTLGRMLGRAGQAPFRFDDYDGVGASRPLWLDGEWHVVKGRHLLKLTTTSTSILSEGATGAFFDMEVSILNPHPQPVPARISFLREDGTRLVETRQLPALSHLTLHANAIAGLEATAASTVIEALNGLPLVAQRTMSWDASGYGAHAGNAVDRPRLSWLFAEGAQGYFDTFYLLANDGPRPAPVRVRFLREAGAPVDRQVTVAPGSRLTLYAGSIRELVNQSFAAAFESDEPIVVERAMYFGRTPFWSGGHESPGSPSAQYRWFHAEGATGPFFDTYLLIANPDGRSVTAQVVYAIADGRLITRSYVLPPYSRRTIGVEHEDPALADVAVSMYVLGDGPLVSERAMYWTLGAEWVEAHNSAGMPSGATRWAVAGGRTGGSVEAQTYLLIANPYFATGTADLRVRFIDEAGGAPVDRSYTLAPGQRLTIRGNDIPGFENTRFGVVVDSQNNVPVYVEQSTYWNAGGVTWAAGTNVVGTPLP